MGLSHQPLDVGDAPVCRVDVEVVGDVVPVIPQRGRVEGQDPDGGGAQAGDVVQLLDQAGKVSDTVFVRVPERADVELVDDGVLVPEGVIAKEGRRRPGREPARRPGVRAGSHRRFFQAERGLAALRFVTTRRCANELLGHLPNAALSS